MVKHNIKVSLRSFKRYKSSFLINFLGLVGGLLTVLFIFVWVSHELSVDKFHHNEDRIYRMISGAGGKYLLNTSPRYAKELEAAIPEIEYVVNSAWGQLDSNLQFEDKVFSTIGEFGSEKFFELFNYPLLRGDKETIFDSPNAILLSERMAMRMFNTTDVLGRKLTWRWYSVEEDAVVTGVYQDPPSNSSAQFDYVLSFKLYEKRFARQLETGRNGRTYIKLREGASAKEVNKKIAEYTRLAYPEYTGKPYIVIKYSDYYLNSIYDGDQPVGGRIEMVRLFSGIGLLILVIACVNFMNLSTARAALRTKEIGVRKAMGALRKSLMMQYLTESCLLSFMAGLTATGLLFLLFPLFQNLLEEPIQLDFNLHLIGSVVGIILLTGILSGSYPALYLSGFQPLRVLKGTFTPTKGYNWLRKGLVVFQFGSSLILIVAVLVLYQQMKYIQNKSLGYNQEHIINFETTGMNGEKQQAFLTEVRRLNGVEKASGISHALFGATKAGANITWDGKSPEQEVWFEWGYVGYDMLELLEIELEKGRFFSKLFGDEQSKVVITKTTQKLMGIEDPIGLKFTVGETTYDIIGVAEDFHFQSLHEQIKPTFFLLNSSWTMKLAIRIDPNRLQGTISEIRALYDTFNPGFPFEYSFHRQDKRDQYAIEDRVSLLSKYAAGLAILISSLGLFGLVSFVAERKAKELGIRKTLGASAKALFGSLSKEFVSPIVIASVLGIITSVFLLNEWLSNFAFHIELSWIFFASGVVLMVLIALATSLSQILKAIFANPIASLRDE